MGSNPISSARTPGPGPGSGCRRAPGRGAAPRGPTVLDCPRLSHPVATLLGAMVVASRRGSLPEGPDAVVGRLAAARHGVVSRAEALAAGVTPAAIRHRLATGRWQRLHVGVYRIAGAPETWRQRLAAACLAAGPGAIASHRAAARLWGLPAVEAAGVEVSAPRGRSLRRPGVPAHRPRRLDPVDVTELDGIPVTTPARTLVDCAAVLDPAALEEALDDALRRGLVSLPRLRWRVRCLARRGRPGVAALRALLEARGAGEAVPESVLETRMARLLRGRGLPPPCRQHPVRDRGRVVAVLDFAYPEARLAVEVDGRRYHSGRLRWQRDLARGNVLTALGWRVLHVTAEDLRLRSEQVVATVAAALARALPPARPALASRPAPPSRAALDYGRGRARRGASGALYPQSAPAGPNSRPRAVGRERAPQRGRRRSGLARRQPVNPVRSGRKQP
jgi:very-short-patch-repair endonuclease